MNADEFQVAVFENGALVGCCPGLKLASGIQPHLWTDWRQLKAQRPPGVGACGKVVDDKADVVKSDVQDHAILAGQLTGRAGITTASDGH